MPTIMLVDNGSLRPTATLQLRHLATALSQKIQQTVHPVSMQHAHKISASELGGKPAHIFSTFMADQLAAGEKDFILLPLFFGKSRAITKFVPDEVEKLKMQFSDFNVNIAEPLYPLPNGESGLTDIIVDHILGLSVDKTLPVNNAVLVDHGSPVPRVTAVRQHLAESVLEKVPAGSTLEEAVMERREGKEYDFNGGLLKDWLVQKARAGETHANVILMFLLPGSHAGEGGDIEEICDSVMKQYPSIKIAISPLISQHPKLVSILENRLNKIINQNN